MGPSPLHACAVSRATSRPPWSKDRGFTAASAGRRKRFGWTSGSLASRRHLASSLAAGSHNGDLRPADDEAPAAAPPGPTEAAPAPTEAAAGAPPARWRLLLAATWRKVLANAWPLVLLHLVCDGAVLLLHRLSHRLTNEGERSPLVGWGAWFEGHRPPLTPAARPGVAAAMLVPKFPPA